MGIAGNDLTPALVELPISRNYKHGGYTAATLLTDNVGTWCRSFDDWVDSIDLLDALHPQTLLAYGMNGRDLPLSHGAPLRLRVERQMRYKSMKYIRRIVVTDEFDDGGKDGNIQNGWAWYTGI